jgi:hypothetical protein
MEPKKGEFLLDSVYQEIPRWTSAQPGLIVHLTDWHLVEGEVKVHNGLTPDVALLIEHWNVVPFRRHTELSQM